MNRRSAPWRRTIPVAGLLLAVLFSARAVAQEPAYVDVWGPAVGSRLPMLEAPDQSGQPMTLDSLAGSQGLLLFLNRSADW